MLVIVQAGLSSDLCPCKACDWPTSALVTAPNNPGAKWSVRLVADVLLTVLTCFCRLAGLSIIYTQATSGLPAVLQHLLINMPVLHEVMVLLTVRIITRPFASQEERFLVRRSNTLGGAYRVIVR